MVDEDISFKRKFKEPPIFLDRAVSEDSNEKVYKKVIETDVSLIEEIEVEVLNIQQNTKSNSFPSEFNLMSHMGLCHTEINEYECTLCLFTTTQQLVLDKHIEMCHKSRNWPNTEENMPDLSKFLVDCTCLICDMECKSVLEAMKHVEGNHLDDIEDLNNNSLNSDSEMIENELSSETLPEQSRSVNVQWVMDNFGSFDENKEYVPPKNPNNNESQKSFMPEHHEEKKHLNCTICDISFSQNSSLKQHIESVHEGRFECSDCDNVFGIKSALIQHIESVHRQKNEKKIVFL